MTARAPSSSETPRAEHETFGRHYHEIHLPLARRDTPPT